MTVLEGPGKRVVGSGKSAGRIGTDALVFLAHDPNLTRRFLALSGITTDQLRHEARKPAFFIGLLDFILAHEPTVMAFATACELDPAEIGRAREALAGPR